MQVAVPWKENAWLVGTHPAPAGERVHSLLQRVLLALGVFALLLAVALVILMAVRPLGRGGDTRAPFHRVKEDMRSLSTLARNTVRQQEELNQERDERMRAEQESNQRLQLLNRALEEKIRMGRDLHDGVIQSLYAAGLSLQAARNTMAAEPEEAGQRMDAGLSLINRTIGDIRSYISGLSPRSVRHDSLAQSLREIVEDLRAGRPVDLELKINDKAAAALSDDQLAETMQISHEAVSNALRHGGAERILIALSPAEGGVDLTIRDNGKGFDPTHTRSGGHGLANIRARVERCAGRLQIDSSSGQGTCLQILWPSTTTS
jgi:signal transduction histidine kinase